MVLGERLPLVETYHTLARIVFLLTLFADH
jgi:hypothetical protein